VGCCHSSFSFYKVREEFRAQKTKNKKTKTPETQEEEEEEEEEEKTVWLACCLHMWEKS